MPETMTPQKLEELKKFATFLQEAQLLGPHDEQLPVPAALYDLMHNLLENLKRGESFTVFPHDALLTTQQAAQVLNVSRAYLNKLLEAEPSLRVEVVGSHRCLRLADVLQLREKRFEQRSAMLNELSALGQELQGEPS